MSHLELTHTEAIRNVGRLRRTLEAAKLLNSTIDLAELTAIILQIVRDEVAVDRGTVYVVDWERQELRSVAAQGIEGNPIRLPLGSGLAGAVALTGKSIDIPDAYADSRFNSSIDVALNYRTKDLFSMPITNRHGQTVGVLQLLNRSAPFQQDDFEFLHDVSVHIGLALENAWLHQQLVEKRKMEQELALAREIQQNLYPRLPTEKDGVEIAASSIMCEEVGGDYLDYFGLPDRRFVIMLGDVSGKGIGAALIMTSLHATCRALLRQVDSLERIAQTLNEYVLDTTKSQSYVTLLAVLVEPATRQLHCLRAGHHPPLLVKRDGTSVWLEEGGGTPIGLFHRPQMKRAVYEVPPESVVVLYTDGIPEAESVPGHPFGLERLQAVVEENRSQTAAGIHESITRSLTQFLGSSKPLDDRTLVVLKFNSQMQKE